MTLDLVIYSAPMMLSFAGITAVAIAAVVVYTALTMRDL